MGSPTACRSSYTERAGRQVLPPGQGAEVADDDIEEVRRVLDAVAAVGQIDDPAERGRALGVLLKAWPEEQTKLRVMRQQAVAELREQGLTYRKIAETLGVAVSRVKQIEQGENWKKPSRTEAAE